MKTNLRCRDAFRVIALLLPVLCSTEVLFSQQREFRGAWVASVGNMDWPSRPGLPVSTMKNEAIRILNRMDELNMNAAILQVRPCADALYESRLEPWSHYLTGRQGRSPGFDPLAFWITEAHRRGIELHAWFNPYRASNEASTRRISGQSIIKSRSDLVVKLRDGKYWQIPTSAASRNHTIAVIMDVVTRYDIDGVHFDDYFYPYNGSFPDSSFYTQYRNAGGRLNKSDWRREAVNTLVKDTYFNIKSVKPHVMFGISPFGIWRPGNPRGIAGLDAYSKLSADSRRWLREGWVDYLTPQLYWEIGSEKQSFPRLLSWWNDQNTNNRYVWPGIRVRKSDEMLNQIRIIQQNNSGMCLFRMGGLMRDSKYINQLRNGPWAREAVVPRKTARRVQYTQSKRRPANDPVLGCTVEMIFQSND